MKLKDVKTLFFLSLRTVLRTLITKLRGGMPHDMKKEENLKRLFHIMIHVLCQEQMINDVSSATVIFRFYSLLADSDSRKCPLPVVRVTSPSINIFLERQ
jgi:hypothetical protein